MNAIVVVVGLVSILVSIVAAFLAGRKMGLETGRAQQAEASAKAIAEAEARAELADKQREEFFEAAKADAVRRAATQAVIEREHAELVHRIDTGDIESVVAEIREKNAKLSQDLERVETQPTVMISIPPKGGAS